jgi:methyltransferase
VIWLAGMVAIIALQRLSELALAGRNRQWMLAHGAQEFGAGHYILFIILHTSWFAGWIIESLCRGPVLSNFWYVWLGLFGVAQALRYWCIISLGHNWNTRILIIPGDMKIYRGPYRFFRHPNYLAVAAELACVPLIFDAWVTSLMATILNIWLLRVRIPAEEEALGQLTLHTRINTR